MLERFRRAAVEQSVADMGSLYAVDAVHDFPFTRPGVPSRIEGREQIVAFMATSWRTSPLRYHSYRTLAIHGTDDPATIVVEQEALGTGAAGVPFALPNIVVLTVREGHISRFRDYVNVLAAADAAGLVTSIQRPGS